MEKKNVDKFIKSYLEQEDMYLSSNFLKKFIGQNLLFEILTHTKYVKDKISKNNYPAKKSINVTGEAKKNAIEVIDHAKYPWKITLKEDIKKNDIKKYDVIY